MGLLNFLVLICSILILFSSPLFLASTRAEPNPPGFDAPDPEVDPNFHCPPGYFFEGNHERQNGPARCTMMTCENHSDLPGCTDDGNTNSQQIPIPGGTQSCSFRVPDAPSLVPQGQFCSSKTCWASAIAMSCLIEITKATRLIQY